MSLLRSLGLPVPGNVAGAAAPAAADALRIGRDVPRQQATVTLVNRSGSDLRLLKAALQFNTARFEPPVPPVIAATRSVTFRVVESTVGMAKTAGSARYHVESLRHPVDLTYFWSGMKGGIVFEGETPFGSTAEAKQDETGLRYRITFKGGSSLADKKLQALIGILNSAGFPLSLVSATFVDPKHTEFFERPDATIPIKAHSDFIVQALDEEHPEAAGTVVYRIEKPGSPHLARMTWRKGDSTPVGTVEPNDGAFVVQAKKASDSRFEFVVAAHDGPPPPPPGPTRVTIVNDAAFALKRDTLLLDNPKAQFKSQPAETLEGGRRTQFEVVAPDPEFPLTNGFMAYSFRPNPQDGSAQAEAESVVAMAWKVDDTPSFAKISPPVEGVTATPGGTKFDIVFTVTGPALAFEPPAKVKQPTLRFGDKGADGWVEYLQESLNHHGASLPVTGNFLGETLKAVQAFQRKFKDQGVLEDGIVGDQTWSFLREGAPEKPKTDGLAPHTFKEKGLEARWVREKNVCRFDAAKDALVMQAISVGDTDQLEGRRVRIRVTNPQGEQKVLERSLGPGVKTSETTQGFTHDVLVEEFATLFGAAAPGGGPPPGGYRVEAFFDGELGSDKFEEVVKV